MAPPMRMAATTTASASPCSASVEPNATASAHLIPPTRLPRYRGSQVHSAHSATSGTSLEPLTGHNGPGRRLDHRRHPRRFEPRMCTNSGISTQSQPREDVHEALAATQRRVGRRFGISAADGTRLTSGRPRPTTTTTLPAGYVLEFRYGCVRISATSGGVRRSVVAGLCPGYRRRQPRPRYPGSRPSGSGPSGYRASRCRAARCRGAGTGCRASWTRAPTSWRWARWATLRSCN